MTIKSFPTLEEILNNAQVGLTQSQELRLLAEKNTPAETEPVESLASITARTNVDIRTSKEKQAVIQAKTTDVSGTNDLLRDTISKALDDQMAAGNKVAEINKDITVTAAEMNASPIETYKKNVANPQARANRSKLHEELAAAEGNYRNVLKTIDDSNWFMKAIRRETDLVPARARLQQAQLNIQGAQANVAGATTNLTNAMLTNTRIAGNYSAQEMAEATQRAKVANNLVQNLKDKITLGSEQVTEYATLMGIEESVMRGAVMELNKAIANNQASESQLAVIFQEVSLASALMRVGEEKKKIDNDEMFYESMNTRLDKVFELMHPKNPELYKGLNYQNTIEGKENASNPYWRELAAGMETGLFNEKAAAKVLTKKYLGNEALTPAETVIMSSLEAIAIKFNSDLDVQIADATDPALKEELRAKRLDPTNPASRRDLANMFEEDKRNSKDNISKIVQSGVLLVPDMKETLFNSPEYQAIVTPEIKDFMLGSGIDFTLGAKGGENAGTQIDTVSEQSLDLIEKAISASTDASGTPDDAIMLQERMMRQMSEGYAAYYKEAVKISADTIGFSNLKTFNVDGITSSSPTSSWITGAYKTKTLNISDKGEWNNHLRARLRARKLARTPPPKISGLNPGTLF